MSYGGAWQIGDYVEIIDREIWMVEPDYDDWGQLHGGVKAKTPASVVGKKGKIVEIQDDRYDTSYPTGYERVYVQIEGVLDYDNENLRWIDTAFIKKSKD
jgi:hypothetical protein